MISLIMLVYQRVPIIFHSYGYYLPTIIYIYLWVNLITTSLRLNPGIMVYIWGNHPL